ncbi:hypothetical protein ACJZ2D_006752 [Fusarium nematophilum]
MVVLVRNAYNAANIVANFLNAPILNPSARDLRRKGAASRLCFACQCWSGLYAGDEEIIVDGDGCVVEEGGSARQFRKAETDDFHRKSITPPKECE